MKYRGIIICIKKNPDVNTSDLKLLHKKCPNKVDFPALSFISPTFYMVCLQPNAWLESYDRHGSFGTKISGSLTVSPVLWVLSSRNTLSVSQSDTASKLYLKPLKTIHSAPLILNLSRRRQGVSFLFFSPLDIVKN